ncbi:uncharacterized protein K02A2.6-like [Topomyia yanbarensis]|uniref:uncharacterized protein K02A2.6-like n=1 Tax=Topomyia yanbarensis TaxID=2498891 RepID=UPI00273B09EF|nr:uncharacterized protein K02A2.6-like [Topomyia yanbarensis]
MEAIVEDELQRLQTLNIITPVTFSELAAPIVVVRKPDRSVRLCADFSTGLNNALEPNNYPLPLPEDIFARMANCTIFGYIDLSDAYLQVEVDEENRKLVVINTHNGLFQFNRLSPGIRTAPGAFQQIMDAMLSGLQCTCLYLDDIIVDGRTRQELMQNLQEVCKRLHENGFTVKICKCQFFMNQVKYLGQLLDAEVTYKIIAAETEGDKILQKVKHYVIYGWPVSKKTVGNPEIEQFFARLESLSIAHKCLMYGERIISPRKLQQRVLDQLIRVIRALIEPDH